MKLSLFTARLVMYVLQTTGQVDVENKFMPRYFDPKERPLATALFKKMESVLKNLEENKSEEEVVLFTQEEKDLIIKLLEIPLSLQDSVYAEDLISLLKQDNV